MARPVWKGSISFGLVSVPMRAFTAARDHTVHFHQLERSSGARVRNHTVSEESGKEVERDDMVLGYELPNGKYATFERDELDDLRPASTRAVEIRDFVALDDVDPIYYQRTYWLAPDGDAAAEPYALLLRAMEDKGRVGIGTVVMRNKQYLTAVRPLDGALAMSTMRFADEVIDRSSIDDIPEKVGKADPKAVQLAGQIIDALAGAWDPSQYHDTYTEEVKKIITAKSKGKTMTPPPSSDDEGGEVIDLMDALRASIERSTGRSRTGTKERPAKKAAATKRSAKRSTAKKGPAKKAAAKKPAAKKPATKRAAKKATAKKAAAKRPTRKSA
ncbi:Ku protein [Aquihabitans sp. McL0605]|uniref:non-homologous end joining protein Ku n=1 Tax=Aquihabitans sp. McL0605 TaxID=3415671 RepID=UPI003CFBA356